MVPCKGKCVNKELQRQEKKKHFSNFEDIYDIIRILKSLENSDVLIDRVSETAKYEIKKTRRWIPWYVIRNFRCFNVRNAREYIN